MEENLENNWDIGSRDEWVLLCYAEDHPRKFEPDLKQLSF